MTVETEKTEKTQKTEPTCIVVKHVMNELLHFYNPALVSARWTWNNILSSKSNTANMMHSLESNWTQQISRITSHFFLFPFSVSGCVPSLHWINLSSCFRVFVVTVFEGEGSHISKNSQHQPFPPSSITPFPATLFKRCSFAPGSAECFPPIPPSPISVHFPRQCVQKYPSAS